MEGVNLSGMRPRGCVGKRVVLIAVSITGMVAILAVRHLSLLSTLMPATHNFATPSDVAAPHSGVWWEDDGKGAL